MAKRNVGPCTVDGCDRIEYATGLCGLHYRRFRTTGSVELSTKPRKRRRSRICTVEGCDQPHQAKGYCGKHYHMFKRFGTPTPPPIEERDRRGRQPSHRFKPLPADHPMRAALALSTELERVDALLALRAGA